MTSNVKEIPLHVPDDRI